MSIKLYQRLPIPFRWHLFFDSRAVFLGSELKKLTDHEDEEAQKLMKACDASSAVVWFTETHMSCELWWDTLKHDNAVWIALRHLEDMYHVGEYKAVLSAVDAHLTESWEIPVAKYSRDGARHYEQCWLSEDEVMLVRDNPESAGWESIANGILDARLLPTCCQGKRTTMQRQGIPYYS